jgi:formylglycine-generating enzyme required for sulfatase activity
MRKTIVLASLVAMAGCTTDGTDPQAMPDAGMTADASVTPDACVGAGCGTMTGTCPTGMVWISPTTCIDAKEATVNDFLEFANSLGTACDDPGPTCTACGGKRCFTSNVDNPWDYDDGWYIEGAIGMSLQHPARYVTHAAAKSACAFKGKRLCRADEWERSCSGPTGLVYPYGNTYEAGRCNSGSGVLGGTPWKVGDRPQCSSTAAPSLLDMSGNVWEWTSECSGNNCVLRGGSFNVDGSFFPTALSCDGTKTHDQANEVFGTDYDFGYRCCASPL